MPACLQAALMFCSCSARASMPIRARISCSRAVTVVSSGKGQVLEEPSSYHRSAVGALYAVRPGLSGDLPLSSDTAFEKVVTPGLLEVGHVPASPYPTNVRLEELVLFHSAILGVTGSGKS